MTEQDDQAKRWASIDRDLRRSSRWLTFSLWLFVAPFALALIVGVVVFVWLL